MGFFAGCWNAHASKGLYALGSPDGHCSSLMNGRRFKAPSGFSIPNAYECPGLYPACSALSTVLNNAVVQLCLLCIITLSTKLATWAAFVIVVPVIVLIRYFVEVSVAVCASCYCVSFAWHSCVYEHDIVLLDASLCAYVLYHGLGRWTVGLLLC